jgi:hypothetical protein
MRFAWARRWGAPFPFAYAVQIVVTLARAVAVAWPWRSHASARLTAAGLMLAALFGTPDSLDDDPWRWLPPSPFGPATGFLADSNAGRKTTLAAILDRAADRA